MSISDPVIRTLYNPPPRIDRDNVTHSPDVTFVTRVINGTLQTEEGSPHVLYYEVHSRISIDDIDYELSSGRLSNKRGLTALVLHGGPGAGCFPRHANFFSPELYEHVVLLDQRGCGKSTPLGEVSMNTLPLLVQDVERLRHHLLEDDGPWDCVLGGSWGCVLALAYAHSFPANIRAMVLRGVCLFRPKEIDWLFGDPPSRATQNDLLSTSNLKDLISGNRSTKTLPVSTTINHSRASELFIKGWEDFYKGAALSDESKTQSNISSNRRVLTQYYHRLIGSNPLIRAKAAQHWFRWEMGIYSSGLSGDNKTNDTKAELLVWNPTKQIWHYENATVINNQSILPFDPDGTDTVLSVSSTVAQSLRRYTKQSTGKTLKDTDMVVYKDSMLEPLRIKDIVETNENTALSPSMSRDPKGQNNTSSSSFDPLTFVPAQAMLTCYYSTNDAYVIHPYQSFLSLQNTSWFSSQIPSALNNPTKLDCYESDVSHSLPPCIAIQGGLDAICPPDTALDLHHVWKELELRIALGSGHSMYDPVIAGEIVKALDRFGSVLLGKIIEKEVVDDKS